MVASNCGRYSLRASGLGYYLFTLSPKPQPSNLNPKSLLLLRYSGLGWWEPMRKIEPGGWKPSKKVLG